MSIKSVMRKIAFKALFLIPLIFYSCAPQLNQWKLAIIKADCPPASYVKIYLPPCNPFDGIEAVVMSSNGELSFYLYALTLLFPFNPNDEEHCQIEFLIENEHYVFIVDRLQGGQCLLLSEDAKNLVIASLIDRKLVEIRTGRYQTTLNYENFVKAYTSL